MKLNFLFCLGILLAGTLSSTAQFQGKVYEQFQDAKVVVDGLDLNAPWCGGINSAQILHEDLNNDGAKDLIIYDNNSYVIKTFINIGTAGQIKYSYQPSYEKNFPAIFNYLILKDYNCDGIADLFHKGLTGVSVYKGYYQANELKFTYFKDLYFPAMFGPVNVFVQPDDIPSIMDVDNDGDIDVVSFSINGTYLSWYKNMQAELGLPCDSMRMEFYENCYGKFYQSFHREVVTGITCKGISPNKKTRHTGNCFALLDIEGDGDYDFIGGNVSFNDAQLLINTGSNAAPLYTLQDTQYNQAGHQLQMPSWPAPFHIDIDNDNDKDLLFTSHADNLYTADYHAVAYYKNIGTDAAPNFVYQHDSLLTPDMIDVGSYSYPTFFDYDKDGKKDLFIGSEGALNNLSGQRICKLAYYRNTSSLGSISFELVTRDFLDLSLKNYKGLFPTFGDITGDGIDDLLMGNVNGSVALYKNYAASNSVQPNFLFSTDSMSGISVGRYSSPLVYDFNQDGKTDLLIGNEVGKITYYEDTSSVSVKKLALQTVSLGDVKAGDVSQIYGYCVPFIGKMDNLNKDYLLIGNIDGTIARYDNFINNLGSFLRIDSNYSLLQTLRRSVPAVADLDGDGKYEMLVGNKLGGLSYYKQVKVVTSSNEIDDFILNSESIILFPNPISNQLNILFQSNIGKQPASIRIQDVSGKVVFKEDFITKQQQSFWLGHLANGMYLADIQIGQQHVVKKIVRN